MTTYQPYERRHGSFYDETRNMTVKEVAAHMRKVIRQTVKDGLLPQDWKYSIRYRTASMCQAIDVDVTIPTDLYRLELDYYEQNGYNTRSAFAQFNDRFAPLAELGAARNLLESIHKAYNYDGSDSMTDYFDVRYYGTVNLRPESWS